VTDALIQYIQVLAAHASTWGFVLIVLFMTIESSFIPFPSEVVMIPAGFLAARGELSFGSPMLDAGVAVVAGIGGSLAGAFINYYLFSWLGAPFLEKYGKYFLLPKAKLERAEEVFLRYGAGATFVCRLLPAIRQLISIPAGISRMPLKSFTLWTGLGAGIWVSILTAVGYGLGAKTGNMTYAEIVHAGKAVVGRDLVYIIPACIVVFVAYVMISNRIMRRGGEPAKA
jgi:membrane protein DedA with SNARE-associated domain